jgi:sugar lactone lactonase YvrE
VRGIKMRRIGSAVVPKLSGVFDISARYRRRLVRVFSALLLVVFANAAYAQNTISTVAGGPPLNNASPTATPIEGPQAVVRDGSGNLYVVNDNGVIYKVTPGTTAPSTMVIYAGTNTEGFSPNGTPATSALTREPIGAAFDASGNLYFSDQNNCVVREITTAGVINTVAGTPGVCNYSGDDGPATSAQLNFPQGVAIDSSGNLYIADINNSIIRRVVLASGIITTYAGTPGTPGFPTNNVSATSTQLAGPVAVAVDAGGNLFIADQNDQIICRVDATSKNITIVAGTGAFGYSGDGGPATSATMEAPDGVAVDSAGNIYISDTQNAVIREVFSPTNPNTPNQINTIVGNHTFGFSGDGGPALSAELTNPAGLFVDSATGNLWIADFWANRIRLYSPGNNKQITTVVGSGSVGDGSPAASASLYYPRNPALDSNGNLFFVDAQNDRIREVDSSGNISTVVGTGIPCAFPTDPCGDGGPATSAAIFMPRTVTIEPSGNLLVSDNGDNRIREVAGGIITTIVGSGNQCGSGQGQVPLPCGDGGPALQASLNDARAAVMDAAGNLYFADAQDNRIREVDTTGTITTIAGGGTNDTAPTGCPGSYSGDGGPAVDSTLGCPTGLDIDSNGNLYVADTDNNRIRKIDTGSPRVITTIAGNGTPGHTGDGGLATSATLNGPVRVSVNGAGNLFISDTGNNVIRRVDGKTGIITTFAGNGTFAFAGDGGPALSASFATPDGVVVDNLGDMYVGDLFNNRIRLVLLNPNVTLSSNTVAFANQAINTSATLPVTVTNSGDAPLTISGISLAGASVFSLATSTSPCPVAPATLAVGANCVIEVAFTPTQFVTSTGTITITDNGPTPGSTQTINVTGTGAAALTVSVTGTGSVTSSPVGITACATTCAATFTGNSQVTLTAAPGTNFTFGGFSTNCTPTGALTCTVTMSAAQTVTATFTSSSAGGGLTISPNTLPSGAVGAAYGQVLIATGGVAPFNFSISSGALPAGLTLGATSGSIAGVPTGPAGPATFTVQVTDSSAPPLTGNATFTVTINAADSSNDAELNGVYAFVFKGFNDSDGTMVVAAGSFVADGHGNIGSGFLDDDSSTGAQPTEEITSGTYTIGADNRGTMSLTTPTGPTVLAISVGDIQSGVATKARLIRFDDVSGTNGQTGSGVMLKQDPSAFSLTAIKGSYAFGESGSNLTNGNPQSGVGFVNADGNGNFTPGGLIDLDAGGTLVTSAAIAGTYALTNETVSNGRISASVTIAGVNGTTSNVLYIISSSQLLFININTTGNSIFSGMAQLQTPPTGGFGLGSLKGNSVIAVQGKPSGGTSKVDIGAAASDGAGNFTLSASQNNSGTFTTGSAVGTYTVASNGRGVLTITSSTVGGVDHSSVFYLDGQNQGFLAGTGGSASEGFIEPGGSGFTNATLSGNYFFGTVGPTNIQNGNNSGVASFDGVGTVQSASDASGPGGILLGDQVASQTYSVASNGQLTFTGQGVVGYVASGCKVEIFSEANAVAGIGTVECQVIQAALTVTEAGTGTGTVTSSPTGINCPTTCSASFESGSQVVLTATPTGNSTFTGFSTNCTPANPQTNPPTCTVTMTGSPTVIVTFTAGAAPPTASLNPTSLTFAGQAIHTTSPAQTVMVTNTGGANLVLGATPLALSGADPGDFAIASGTTCTPSLSIAPSGSCVANISFTPTATGARSATLIFTDNSGGVTGATQTVPLNGAGTAAASPSASLNPTNLTFAGQVIHTTSPPQTVTVTNTGTGTLNFAGFTINGANPGDFGVPLPNSPAMCNPLEGTLAAGASCTINVLFTPTATGTRTATLNIADNATGSPQTVTLTGTGTSASGAVTVTPSSLTFASQSLNSTSPAQSVTVSNTGTGTVNFAGFTITGANSSDFALGSGSNAGTCNSSGSLAASTNCTINVTFTPTATGTRAATLGIADNATGSPQTVALTGTGVGSPVTIGMAPGSPSTVNTTPGGSAVFGLTLTAVPGTTGTVQLGCTSASSDITCQIVPSSIVLTGQTINVAIVVDTFCKGSVPAFGPSIPGGLLGGLAMLLASISLCGAVWTFRRRPRWALSFGVLILIAVGMSACGNLAKSPGGAATKPGPYALIVTATAPNGAVSSVDLTLNVLP